MSVTGSRLGAVNRLVVVWEEGGNMSAYGVPYRAVVRSHKDVQETTGHGNWGFEISETHQDLVWST